MEIKKEVDISPFRSEDLVKWNASLTRAFTIHLAWEIIRMRVQKVKWHHLLWFKHHTPKHTIIAWMAMRGKLQTKDHLVQIGLINNMDCVFCNKPLESFNHLLFACLLTRRI